MYPIKGQEITLVGFEDWKNLVESFYNNSNEQLIDEFISVNMKKYKIFQTTVWVAAVLLQSFESEIPLVELLEWRGMST